MRVISITGKDFYPEISYSLRGKNTMILQKVTSAGLAHNSYFLSAGGTAAVIDPRRDCDVYVDLAREHQARITHIFETHRNEDYVIGSLELAGLTGADIYHGAAMDFSYGHPVKEGDQFRLGSLQLYVLETPGHTMESISVVVRDPGVSEQPMIVFTGDALFAGEVGRTDFFGPEKRARVSEMLYESLHAKLLPLGDGVIVCPAHGTGSVCGSEISDQEYTTIGFERVSNPLLSLDRRSFIERKVREHHYMPPYFRMMEKYNKEGPALLHHLPALRALSPSEVMEMASSGAQIVDIRAPGSYAGGHVPGSLSIWRDGIPAFAGWFLSYDHPIIIIDDFNLDLCETTGYFIRMGYDRIAGYLAGGLIAWAKAGMKLEQLESWPVHTLHKALENERLFLLDVRDQGNRTRYGHILGSRHIYVGELPHRIAEIPKEHPIAVYCDAGYKGSLAAGILKNSGFSRVINVIGGYSAWKNAGFPVEKQPGPERFKS